MNIDGIQNKNILVIGDIMLDTYFYGDVERISPEAPVPIFKKKYEKSVPGGAANVAMNLTAAKQNVYLMSIVGSDDAGSRLVELLKQNSINTNMIISEDRITTEKIRFVSSNNQQVMRLDNENSLDISSLVCNEMVRRLGEVIDDIDIIIISDYLKGVLSYELCRKVITIAKSKNVDVVVDVKGSECEKYAGSFLIKPNQKELSELTRMPADSEDEIIEASNYLRNKCNCNYVLTTCGSKGMILVDDNGYRWIEALAREVFDVSGAGDTTIAYLASCLANDFSVIDAVQVANCAAGIQVGKLGTSTVGLDEMKYVSKSYVDMACNKILNTDELSELRENCCNKKIVFTNGCFDILHAGHVRYLNEASNLGDVLIIGINSDESVKRLKGTSRPINCQDDRVEVLQSLQCVDYIVIFEEDTPYDVIRKLKPDILVKGGDYSETQVVGRDIVVNSGGKVIILPFLEGRSTTKIISKIRS